MLEQLFGSQTRVKLLQLFLNNPEERYFVRELTRIIDSQINAVRRELENLQNLGLICEVEAGEEGNTKMKYFQAVKDFTLYPELKSMVQKMQFILEQEFSNNLGKLGQVDYLALTGSFVGEKTIPVDFLIVGTIETGKLKKLIKKYEAKFNREINYTLFNPEEFLYRRNVADKFLYSILDGNKIVMIDEVFNNNGIK